VTDDSLLAELKQAATPPPPPNFRPGAIFDGQRPTEITTPPLPKMETDEEFEQAVRDLGYPLPEGYTLVLTEMQIAQHENFWTRQNQGEDAVTVPSNSFRYRFKVVLKSARHDEDIAVLMAEAKAAMPRTIKRVLTSGKTSKVINLADFQIGKTDELGGTKETLARSEAALDIVIRDLEANPVDELLIVDPGDSLEGFESSPNAPQTNDLDQTEQLRVWRRILWRWIEALAPLAPRVIVIGVPSNHCRVRKGKAVQGGTLDDWGIEAISIVSDIAAVNPAAYGHVQFIVPNDYEEHVLFTLIGGQVLGVVHGHQKGSANALAGWIKSTGRRGLAQADIVIVGHFHHLVCEAFGDMQWLFICPTNDNGSSWFTPSSGERSEPGILTLRVDEKRWEMDTIWLGDIAA
jgi:hypothetical protein